MRYLVNIRKGVVEVTMVPPDVGLDMKDSDEE
jgi:hypothetical protein